MRINLNAGIGASETTLDKTAASRPSATTRAVGESRFIANEMSVPGLAATVLAAPEVRQEKVQALRAQIEKGAYQVSSTQVAASIFEALRVSR